MRFHSMILAMSGLALALGAQAADLNIYTYDSFIGEWGPGPAIEKAFEKQCACDIEFMPAGDGAALLTRLQMEGDLTQADIALGLDQNLIPRAQRLDTFLDHEFPAQYVEGSGVAWNSPKFVAYDWGHFAFVYNQDIFEEKGIEVPHSLESLADSAIKVVIEDPRASTPGLGLALWAYEIYGENTEDFWRKMKDNIVTVTPGWSEAYSLFLEGEAEMVLSYTTSPAYHRIAEEDNRFFAAKFDEGHAMQIELVGILQNSDDVELAKEFIQFLLSEDAQSALVNANWMYPVIEMDVPEGFDAAEGYQSIEIMPNESVIDAAIDAFEAGLKN